MQEPGVAPSEALIPGLHEYTWMLEGYNLRVVYLHGMAWYSMVTLVIGKMNANLLKMIIGAPVGAKNRES